jgi:hypothetical protein
MTDRDRFWSKVDKSGPIPAHAPELGRCWQWLAATQYGYGIFSFSPESRVHKTVKAHRWIYEREVGPVPHTLDHLCRNRGCVRPSHLEPVTMAENNRRSQGFRLTRTHCPQGHSYEEHGRLQRSGDNYYPVCKVCDAERHRQRRRRETA